MLHGREGAFEQPARGVLLRPRMRITIVVLVLGVAGAALATGRAPRVDDEAPRATDLLRAERKAEEVRRRLELPAVRKTPGWLSGGDGWGGPATAPARPGPDRQNPRETPIRRSRERRGPGASQRRSSAGSVCGYGGPPPPAYEP
jgi:hypothetical protein